MAPGYRAVDLPGRSTYMVDQGLQVLTHPQGQKSRNNRAHRRSPDFLEIIKPTKVIQASGLQGWKTLPFCHGNGHPSNLQWRPPLRYQPRLGQSSRPRRSWGHDCQGDDTKAITLKMTDGSPCLSCLQGSTASTPEKDGHESCHLL